EASSASESPYYYNIGAVAASSVGGVRVFGVASATNIEASSASESSYYYNIGAVAASSVGRVRVFGVASATTIEASSASTVVLLLQHRRSRRLVGGLSESLRRGERHEQIETSSASESSDYCSIVAVAADSSAVLLVSPRRRARGESSAWRTPRPSRPAAPQSRPITTTVTSQSPSMYPPCCQRGHVDGLTGSLRRGERGN
ncbi:hypothetical protein PR001_g32804, partial [Phytophthora rubi]